MTTYGGSLSKEIIHHGCFKLKILKNKTIKKDILYRWFLNKFIDENNLTGMRKIASFEYVKRMNKEVLSCCHDSGTKKNKKQKTSTRMTYKLLKVKQQFALYNK